MQEGVVVCRYLVARKRLLGSDLLAIEENRALKNNYSYFLRALGKLVNGQPGHECTKFWNIRLYVCCGELRIGIFVELNLYLYIN